MKKNKTKQKRNHLEQTSLTKLLKGILQKEEKWSQIEIWNKSNEEQAKERKTVIGHFSLEFP